MENPMAADSLLGAVDQETLAPETLEFLSAFLADTQNTGGVNSTTSLLPGGSVLVLGTGANNETQGVVVSRDGAAVAGELSDGVLNLSFSLPAGVTLVFEGLSETATVAEAQSYIAAQIAAGVPEGSPLRASLETALDTLISAMTGAGAAGVVVRIVAFDDRSSGSSSGLDAQTTATGQTIVFDAGANTSTDALAILLSTVQAGNTLKLIGVENGMLIGSGSVVVEGSKAATLVGDFHDQHIVGGAGADTLIGGGGNDTLDGGDGADVYGFNALGHYTIQFGQGDSLAFLVDGIDTVEQLLPFVTGFKDENNSVEIEFVDGGLTITLVGVSASDLTTDMIKFSL
jgi:Ca2+-binding RTX toxin-like protein